MLIPSLFFHRFCLVGSPVYCGNQRLSCGRCHCCGKPSIDEESLLVGTEVWIGGEPRAFLRVHPISMNGVDSLT